MNSQSDPVTQSLVLTTEQSQLLRSWRERVAAGTFSRGIVATRGVSIMGASGDQVLPLGVISGLDVLADPEALSPDERFAATELGRIVIATQQSLGRAVVAVASPFEMEVVYPHTFDPTDRAPLVARSPLVGG